MTQLDLAIKCDMSEAMIKNIELNRSWPSEKTLSQITKRNKEIGMKNTQVQGLRGICLIMVLTYHFCFRFFDIFSFEHFFHSQNFPVQKPYLFFIIHAIILPNDHD